MAIDWYSFHAQIAPIDTGEALQTALADPEQRWYARRRIAALAASGALTAAFNPNLHPRGRDGKFIEKFGWVRWFEDQKWQNGWVQDIDPTTGALTVRDHGGQKVTFPNAKTLYAQPKPKARLKLPNPATGEQQPNWKKVGGQGGSNPGGMYEIDGSFAAESPEISKRSPMFTTMTALKQKGSKLALGNQVSSYGHAADAMPTNMDVAVVPRIDGTPGRYDVVQKMGSKWYRVPESGPVTVDDLMKADLEVSPDQVFGAPGSNRRTHVQADLGTVMLTRGDYDVEDVASAVQQVASPLPKVGDRYYVKTMNIPERARNEALANELYELLGVPVPDVAVGADGKTISSKVVGNTVAFDPSNADHVKAAQEGFVADTFLSNWDVIGLTFDNIQIDQDGRAWRIDAGGALAYRAQGKPKGPMFGKDVGELSSLRNASINPQAAKVYGSITNAQLVEQAKILQAVQPSQLLELAAAHDLPDYGDTLVARRKSVLDQLGIPDPPPVDEPSQPGGLPGVTWESLTTPKSKQNLPDLDPTFNVQQMGTGPHVADTNYAQQFNALDTETYDSFGPSISDATRKEFFTNAVFPRSDGDLYVYHSGYTWNGDVGSMLATNLLNGKTEYFGFDGSSPILSDYAKNDPSLDQLVDELSVSRQVAIDEIVAQSKTDDLASIMVDSSKYTDVDALRHWQTAVTSWSGLNLARDWGQLGPTGAEGSQEWPIRNAEDGSLWKIDALATDGVKLHRLDGGEPGVDADVDLTKESFAATGPWFRPGNDTTAAIWLSKAAPDVPPVAPDEGGYEQHQIDAHLNAPDADTETPDITPTDPDAPGEQPDVAPSDYATALAQQQGETAPPTVDAELEALIAQEEAIAEANMAAAESTGPGSNQKITNDVVDGLGASPGHLSTELSPYDLEHIKNDLLGKSVVVLPIDAHDNPNWEAKDLGTANGLGTVEDVTVQQVNFPGYYENGTYKPSTSDEVVRLKVKWANGQFSWVNGGEKAKFKKVVIPVETAPQTQQVVFKQNNDIVINGEKVGTWWKPYSNPAGYDMGNAYYSYSGVIDGDHSVTGKPMSFAASKQANLKIASANLVVPVTPKVTKPKSSKITATEDEIKALNDQLADVQASIDLNQQALEDLANAEPVGVPLGDGTQPKIGDWVFSTKDGKWGQIAQVAPKFGAKNKADPANYVRVKFVVDGKPVSINRTRATLVSAPAPGEQPFVMSTKAVQTPYGEWIGPGVTVATIGDAASGTATVLDTTADGNVKVLNADGTQKWVTAKKLTATSGTPTLKSPPVESTASADDLNAQLAVLNAQHAKLTATIASTVVAKPKKKKEVGVPYPGPAGMTIKQSKGLAEAREAKGLKNMKDGYVPTPGMILRHNDGTQYAVMEMGDEWSSHKNSVQVAPVNAPYDYKWRSVSTMVVDHDAMLTDKNGEPLPIVSQIEGTELGVKSGLLLRKEYTKTYYTPDPLTGKTMYRKKEMEAYYVVDEYGAVKNLDGTPVTPYAIQPGMPVERIGYIDTEHVGGKKLTVSVQKHHNDQVGNITYAVIHDPDEAAGIPLAKAVEAPSPTTPEPPASSVAPSVPTPPTPTPQPPSTSGVEVPTGDLPVFTGAKPEGMELPHPPTTSSSAGVPIYQAQGGTPTLDVAGVAGARSVTTAIAESISTAKNNQQNGEKQWVSTYGLADHDVIEDMMVQSQVVKDSTGKQFVEVRFRVEQEAARKNHTTFITSSTNEAGDWEFTNRNSKNMVPGDMIAVRTSSGGGATPGGALRPDGGPGEGKTPNATVTAAPVLIGKNKAGTYDVWRTQVITAGGDIGYIDLEDRDDTDTVATAYWDPTKPRVTNGGKDLNPNAKNDGWSVKAKSLAWERSQSGESADERDKAAIKLVGGGNTANVSGSGWTLQRDYQGAHVEYRTSAVKNSADGQVVIRVPVDDPDAQRKISEAMELVGVSKEAQKPPDKAALVSMATNKVFEQFNKTYTRGATPNSPQQALDAIDKAVGAKLGRPATMADISLRMSPDGRVQVLVSEDVSRAIVATNGVKAYTHHFASAGMMTTVEGALTGEHPGLMSTTERWSHGMFFFGMSSGSDHGHDSADHLFFRMSKSASTSSSNLAIVDPVVMHRHVDYYWQPSDSFGTRQSNQLNWLTVGSPGGGNELMLQRRLEASLVDHIVVNDSQRQILIERLKKRGVTTAPNGKPLDQFFVTSGGAAAIPKKTVSFGDEITLEALPDTVPAAPPLVVV